MVCLCEFSAEDPSTHCTDNCLNRVLMIEWLVIVSLVSTREIFYFMLYYNEWLDLSNYQCFLIWRMNKRVKKAAKHCLVLCEKQNCAISDTFSRWVLDNVLLPFILEHAHNLSHNLWVPRVENINTRMGEENTSEIVLFSKALKNFRCFHSF